MSLVDKIVLVTGASRGIGLAIATEFIQQGCIVIGTATSADCAAQLTVKLQQLAASFGNTNQDKCQAMLLDLHQHDNIADLVEQIKDAVGQAPEILINNAGMTKDNLALRMSYADWCQVLNVNLTGSFLLTQACLRPMLAQRWGRIINIGSVVASLGNAGQANYTAAKAGLQGLTKSLAREIASRNITVNMIAPGFIATDMTAKLPESQVTQLLAQIPLARMGQPEDIAAAALFLAQPQSSYITGQTIHVNGGMLMP